MGKPSVKALSRSESACGLTWDLFSALRTSVPSLPAASSCTRKQKSGYSLADAFCGRLTLAPEIASLHPRTILPRSHALLRVRSTFARMRYQPSVSSRPTIVSAVSCAPAFSSSLVVSSSHLICETQRTMGKEAGESCSWIRLIAGLSARLTSRS